MVYFIRHLHKSFTQKINFQINKIRRTLMKHYVKFNKSLTVLCLRCTISISFDSEFIFSTWLMKMMTR